MSKLKDHGCTINEHITSLDGNSCECGYFTHQLIQSHTEKLKLLAEVRERVVGEDELSIDPLWAGRQGYWAKNELRVKQRDLLTKLEAEL